jgi:hypothetical protein
VAIGGRYDKTDPFCDQEATIYDARVLDQATGPGQSCSGPCTSYHSSIGAPVKTFIHDIQQNGNGHLYPPRASAEIVAFFKAHALP